MNVPFFSVVIPLYNKENFIANTLHSVLAQTFTDFEIIVVNDISTDNSVAIATKVQDKRIRIVDHPFNKGLSASRNTGIKNATAPFVAFLDADDIWKPQFLEKIHELIIKYPEASLFATKYEEVYSDTIIIEPKFNLLLENNLGLIDYYRLNLNKSIYYPSCLCVKKEVFETTGYYDENITYSEDIDFNIRSHYNFRMAYCDHALVSYMMNSQNQITQSGLKNKKIPDFNKYETLAKNRPDIKKYLDFHRYVMAKSYRMDGDIVNFNRMVQNLNFSNLNSKQRFLLRAPLFLVKMIIKFKKLLLKRGVMISSYSK